MSFNKDYSNKVDEKLKKWFKNTFNFSNNDINKVIFLLRKAVYPYDYISDWEKCIEATPEKEEFYSNLNMEDITDAEYMHAEGVCKDFEIKNLGEYCDFYLKSDALLLVDVFKNFRKICSKIYHLDFVKFLSTPRLASQAALKIAEVKLELLPDIHVLLMVEKGIRGVILHGFHRCAKVNNKYMKDYDKNKKSSYLKYGM